VLLCCHIPCHFLLHFLCDDNVRLVQDTERDSNAFRLDLRPHVVVQVASDSFQRASKEPEAKLLRQMGGNPPDRPGSVQHAVREEALQPKIAEHLQMEAVDPNVDLAACMIQRSFRCFVGKAPVSKLHILGLLDSQVRIYLKPLFFFIYY
jgi:hypothetical protein